MEKPWRWTNEMLRDLRSVGYAYIEQGIYDTALPFFQTLILVSPESAYDLQTLGALYLQMNRNDEAVRMCDRALQIDPQHLPTQLNRIKALLALGYKRQAKMGLESLVLVDHSSIAGQAEALLLSLEP